MCIDMHAQSSFVWSSPYVSKCVLWLLLHHSMLGALPLSHSCSLCACFCDSHAPCRGHNPNVCFHPSDLYFQKTIQDSTFIFCCCAFCDTYARAVRGMWCEFVFSCSTCFGGIWPGCTHMPAAQSWVYASPALDFLAAPWSLASAAGV